MLKLLHKDDTQITPFVVTKGWELSNVTNEDVILMEHSGSDGLPVAVEYLEYGIYSPITASGCSVAKEEQTQDRVNFRDGLKVTGIFYPETDPQNPDGTYQRVVYAQVFQMFYNDYRDPTKMWGMEEIDFDKSQTKKFVADKFKIFEIPREIYGEKVLEKSVELFDTTTDNNYIITDDGNCNLFAGTNLFSRQQELGRYLNNFYTGSDAGCAYYDTISIPDVPILGSLSICHSSIYLYWNLNAWAVTDYIIERSTDGITYTQYQDLTSGLSYLDTNVTSSTVYWYRIYAINLLGSSSFSNVVSQSIDIITWDIDPDIWDSGSICGPDFWDSASIVPLPGPNSLTGMQDPPYNAAIQLSWSYAGSQSLADGFLVYRSIGPSFSPYTILQTISDSYVSTSIDSTVIYNNDYGYRVFAYSGSVTSSWYAGSFLQYVFPPPCNTSPFPPQYFTESLLTEVDYDLV